MVKLVKVKTQAGETSLGATAVIRVVFLRSLCCLLLQTFLHMRQFSLFIHHLTSHGNDMFVNAVFLKNTHALMLAVVLWSFDALHMTVPSLASFP